MRPSTYTVKTHYTDAAGSPATVSTNYTVTAPSSCAGMKTVTAYADSWVSRENKTTNYGSDSYDWVRAGAEVSRSLIAFPLLSTGSGGDTCAVSSAVLKLYAGSSTSTDGTVRLLQAFRAADSWTESTVTWNNQPGTTGTAATTSSANGWRSWDVTTQVQEMYTGGNYGFLVRDSVETGGGGHRWFQRFDSREYTNKPVLDVTLTASGTAVPLARPGAPTGLTVAANADGTRTLTWTAPSGTPAPEFYRIYCDGGNYTDRVDTAGATGSSVTWTNTRAAPTPPNESSCLSGSSHTYRVTAVSAALAESAQTSPVSG